MPGGTGDKISTGTRRREGGAPFAFEGFDPQQLAALLEQNNEPQLLLAATGRVLAINQAATRAIGVARDQAIGSLLSSCARGLQTETLCAALASADERALKLVGQHGQELGGTLAPLRNAEGVVSAFCLTLTSSEHASAGTLASVVRLTGELGHDLNNQLAAVLNYAFVVERRLGTAGKDITHLAELRAAAWRAAGLTRWLQLGGRRRAPGIEPLGVSTTLAGLEPLLRHLAREVPVMVRVATPRVEIWAALPDVELIVVALTGAALERVSEGAHLELTASVLPTRTSTGTIREDVRITCSWSASDAPHRAARDARPHAHGSLRRALRRSSARLGHDEHAVWADFPSTPAVG